MLCLPAGGATVVAGFAPNPILPNNDGVVVAVVVVPNPVKPPKPLAVVVVVPKPLNND